MYTRVYISSNILSTYVLSVHATKQSIHSKIKIIVLNLSF